MKRRPVPVLTTVVLAGLLLAACTPPAAPAPTQVRPVPTQTTEPTRSASSTAAPTAGP